MTDKEKNMDNVEKNMDLETSRQTSSGLDGGCDFTVEENILMRRISLLADRNIERFMEDMWDDSEMAAENIDKINRIGKEYARRIQLMEDKATERIGIGGKGGLPFKFVINKHYPSAPDADKDEENDTVEGCAANE